MIFWILFSLWLIAVVLPFAVKLFEPDLQWRWIMLWELLMFSPLLIAFGFIVLLFLVGRSIKINPKTRDMYIPKMPRDWYLPRRK